MTLDKAVEQIESQEEGLGTRRNLTEAKMEDTRCECGGTDHTLCICHLNEEGENHE